MPFVHALVLFISSPYPFPGYKCHQSTVWGDAPHKHPCLSWTKKSHFYTVRASQGHSHCRQNSSISKRLTVPDPQPIHDTDEESTYTGQNCCQYLELQNTLGILRTRRLRYTNSILSTRCPMLNEEYQDFFMFS